MSDRRWAAAGWAMPRTCCSGCPIPGDLKYRSLPEERLRTPPEAARNAEIVVLATPWPATEAAVKSLGDLSGKTVIDCTNPLGMGPDGLELVLGHTTSGWRTSGGLGAWRGSVQDTEPNRRRQHGQGGAVSGPPGDVCRGR